MSLAFEFETDHPRTEEDLDAVDRQLVAMGWQRLGSTGAVPFQGRVYSKPSREGCQELSVSPPGDAWPPTLHLLILFASPVHSPGEGEQCKKPS